MKKWATIISSALAIISGTSNAESDKLQGVWISTTSYNDIPPVTLTFQPNNQLKVENYHEHPIKVHYSIDYKQYEHLNIPESFAVSFEYSYKAKRGNGSVVDQKIGEVMLYHEENGQPILSTMVIELDGRGLIILREYLPKDKFKENFTSNLAHKLNDREPIPTYKETD